MNTLLIGPAGAAAPDSDLVVFSDPPSSCIQPTLRELSSVVLEERSPLVVQHGEGRKYRLYGDLLRSRHDSYWAETSCRDSIADDSVQRTRSDPLATIASWPQVARVHGPRGGARHHYVSRPCGYAYDAPAALPRRAVRNCTQRRYERAVRCW